MSAILGSFFFLPQNSFYKNFYNKLKGWKKFQESFHLKNNFSLFAYLWTFSLFVKDLDLKGVCKCSIVVRFSACGIPTKTEDYETRLCNSFTFANCFVFRSILFCQSSLPSSCFLVLNIESLSSCLQKSSSQIDKISDKSVINRRFAKKVF